MKLVKIEDCWINLDAIVSVRERNSIENEPGTQVCLTNGDAVFFDSSIEKVLQAIEGSKEHLNNEKYLSGRMANVETEISQLILRINEP